MGQEEVQRTEGKGEAEEEGHCREMEGQSLSVREDFERN